MNDTINEDPAVLCNEIEERLRTAKPIAADIATLKRQLRSRHAIPGLNLRSAISTEEILEGFFRCVLVHYLHQRFELHVDAIPGCVNSPHKAVRRVCAVPARHRHHDIADEAWAAAWDNMRVEHREIDERAAGAQGFRHADLYVVARNEIVSCDFKYFDDRGFRDPAAWSEQLKRHAAHHAFTLLVLYSGAAGIDVLDHARANLERLATRKIRIVGIHGPAISAVPGVEAS